MQTSLSSDEVIYDSVDNDRQTQRLSMTRLHRPTVLHSTISKQVSLDKTSQRLHANLVVSLDSNYVMAP